MQSAYFVAKYLKTHYEVKKHGGYNIYEDKKIKICSDTYYPNLDIYVKTPDGKDHLVLLRSGHGYNQEYHSGEWEKYIEEVLYPKALEAKKKMEENEKNKEMKTEKEKFSNATKKLDKIFEDK